MTWRPQPGPQTAFVDCAVFEVVYGGARGGGKTDAALGDFFFHVQRYGAAARGLLVRRTRAALEPALARARQIYAPAGACFVASRSRFEWPCGASLALGHLQNDADAEAYQGHDYTRVYVEELTQFPSPAPVDRLKATLRSAAGVPCGFRATCNPGGPGHAWVKSDHVDNGPYELVAAARSGRLFGSAAELGSVFIPARVSDNPALLALDPLYPARLALSGSKPLVDAWLKGDWNIVEGAFFDKWSAANVVAPFVIPGEWRRFRSLDWGYATPFSVGWWVVVDDPVTVGGVRIPRGAIVRYREWYGSNGRANEGLRLEAEAVAAGILEIEREAGERMTWAVADPSIFRRDSGPSIAERMAAARCYFGRADNTRVGRLGALSGWDQMRARIAGQGEGPMLFVFSTCRDFLRTVPVLGHDRQRPEDLHTDAEDHIADETRYACLSRPLPAAPRAPPGVPPDIARWRASDELSRRAIFSNDGVSQLWKTL